MNEMQHQQNHIWFKGKNLKIKHIMPLSIGFRNHVNWIIDTYLLFKIKLFKKAYVIL